MDDDDGVKAEALEILGMFQVLPRLVVFDLDYTIWPFYWFQRWGKCCSVEAGGLTNYAEDVNTYERNMRKWRTMYSKSSRSSEKNEKE